MIPAGIGAAIGRPVGEGAAAQLGHAFGDLEQAAGGAAAQEQDVPRPQQLDLALEEGLADRDLGRGRRPVAGRAPEDDVGDPDRAPVQADRGQHPVEQLAAGADERLALAILLGPRAPRRSASASPAGCRRRSTAGSRSAAAGSRRTARARPRARPGCGRRPPALRACWTRSPSRAAARRSGAARCADGRRAASAEQVRPSSRERHRRPRPHRARPSARTSRPTPPRLGAAVTLVVCRCGLRLHAAAEYSRARPRHAVSGLDANPGSRPEAQGATTRAQISRYGTGLPPRSRIILPLSSCAAM